MYFDDISSIDDDTRSLYILNHAILRNTFSRDYFIILLL